MHHLIFPITGFRALQTSILIKSTAFKTFLNHHPSSSLLFKRKEFWQVSSFIQKQASVQGKQFALHWHQLSFLHAECLPLQIVSSKTLAGAGSLDINVGFKSCSCIDHPLVSGEGRSCKLHRDFFQICAW